MIGIDSADGFLDSLLQRQETEVCESPGSLRGL